MSKRIGYVKGTEEGLLQSTKIFMDNEGRELQVLLNLNDFSYNIINVNTNQSVFSQENFTNNSNNLKKAAKNALTSLGISFDNETRNRNGGLVGGDYVELSAKSN